MIMLDQLFVQCRIQLPWKEGGFLLPAQNWNIFATNVSVVIRAKGVKCVATTNIVAYNETSWPANQLYTYTLHK